MPKIQVHDLMQFKHKQEKIACLTCYDASFAHLLDENGIDVILVGDTLGNVIQGHHNTIPVEVKDIAYHTKCVCRGTKKIFVIADLPFASYASREQALENSVTLLRAGAQMVKLEGDNEHVIDIVKYLVNQGVPVCGHIGLTPQQILKFGKYKIQGKNAESANKMRQQAQKLQEAGIQLLVLECVPENLAAEISEILTIPTIGIGAGKYTDGQILVLYDILGISGKKYKFCKNFLQNSNSLSQAIQNYVEEVKARTFPEDEHIF